VLFLRARAGGAKSTSAAAGGTKASTAGGRPAVENRAPAARRRGDRHDRGLKPGRRW
jgi:hypothetical protein